MQGWLKGKRITVVEDDTVLGRSIALYLQIRGAHVETFECAEDCGEALNRDRFDLVISGYRLPGEDGISFLRRVREGSPAAATLLIASRIGTDLSMAVSNAWIDGILAKPFSTGELEAALSRVIGGGRSRDGGVIETM